MHVTLAQRAAAVVRPLVGARVSGALARSPLAARLRPILSGDSADGPRIVTICGGPLRGMRMSVDLAREKYYWLGTHEPRAQRAFALAINTGDVIYDVGAHAGYFTLLAAKCAGPGGRVLAFEAYEPNLHRLRASVAANHLLNVDARALAISDACGDARFALHDSSLEGMLLGDDALPPSHHAERTVATTTIDELAAGGAPPPAVIKIDVEGAEARVIAGARDTLAAHKPSLLIEIHSEEAGAAVAAALPVPYLFENIDTRCMVTRALTPGHYLGRAR
jgi:FkbM family methyltransferase